MPEIGFQRMVQFDPAQTDFCNSSKAIPFTFRHELEEQLAEGMSRTEWNGLLKALDKLSAHAQGCEGNEQEASLD